MSSEVAGRLVGWLRSTPGSWLEEVQQPGSRALLHKVDGGETLNSTALNLDVMSALLELGWDGVIKKTSQDRAPLHSYRLSDSGT